MEDTNDFVYNKLFFELCTRKLNNNDKLLLKTTSQYIFLILGDIMYLIDSILYCLTAYYKDSFSSKLEYN